MQNSYIVDQKVKIITDLFTMTTACTSIIHKKPNHRAMFMKSSSY